MHSAADARLDEATGQIRPACGQPLASKCRVEPTNLYLEETNTRSTASSNGCVELEVKLIEGVEWGGGRRSNLAKDSSVRNFFKQIFGLNLAKLFTSERHNPSER
jgi:hypothetical protein